MSILRRLKNNCKKDEKHLYIFQDLGNYAFTERDNNKPQQTMTEKEIIKTIKKHSTPEMWNSIIDLHETSINEEWDEPYSIKDSFDHIDDQSDEHGYKHLQTPCRKVNIALGVYVPITQEEINNTFVSHGKKWDFKLGGVAYRFSHHVDS